MLFDFATFLPCAPQDSRTTSLPMQEDPEEALRDWETQVPPLSGSAFMDARDNALNSGQSVLQATDGVIYEVFPDGSQVEVKRIQPPHFIKKGRLSAHRDTR
jgi:hypothetical protein